MGKRGDNFSSSHQALFVVLFLRRSYVSMSPSFRLSVRGYSCAGSQVGFMCYVLFLCVENYIGLGIKVKSISQKSKVKSKKQRHRQQSEEEQKETKRAPLANPAPAPENFPVGQQECRPLQLLAVYFSSALDSYFQFLGMMGAAPCVPSCQLNLILA